MVFHNLVHTLILAALFLGLGGLPTRRVEASARAEVERFARDGSASDLIAAVNGVRSANGLGALKPHNALMAAAQAQSDYQASNGTITHSGAGGSSPGGRAIASGYGAGGKVYVSENIAGGSGMTAQQAVNIWQGDGLHLGTMLNASAVHIGAGYASDGDSDYYTLLVGYIVGEEGSGGSEAAAGDSSTAASGNTANQPASDAPQAAAAGSGGLVASTPDADGAIYHIVGAGQALWNIAALYEIGLTDLLSLNQMNENSMLRPGDKLLIRAAPDTPTPEPTATETPDLPPTRTRPPTRTPRPTLSETEVALAQANREQTAQAASPTPPRRAAERSASLTQQSSPPNPLWVALIVFSLLGAGLVIVGGFLRKGSG